MASFARSTTDLLCVAETDPADWAQWVGENCVIPVRVTGSSHPSRRRRWSQGVITMLRQREAGSVSRR